MDKGNDQTGVHEMKTLTVQEKPGDPGDSVVLGNNGLTANAEAEVPGNASVDGVSGRQLSVEENTSGEASGMALQEIGNPEEFQVGVEPHLTGYYRACDHNAPFHIPNFRSTLTLGSRTLDSDSDDGDISSSADEYEGVSYWYHHFQSQISHGHP